MDRQVFEEKLRRVNALIRRPGTEGERQAAIDGRARLVRFFVHGNTPEDRIERKFKLLDIWSVNVFVTLCKKYGLRPYRYKRQRKTSIAIQARSIFLESVFEPHFARLTQC